MNELTAKLVYFGCSKEKIENIKEELFEYSKTTVNSYTDIMEKAIYFISAGIATDEDVVEKVKTINIPISMLHLLLEL